MKNPFASRELPDPTRRRAELAIAVAQERLLSTHVKYALQLIELTEGEMEFDRAIEIYARQLNLDDDDARVVHTQVLARLGERADLAEQRPAHEQGAEREGEEGSRSLFGQLKARLRGRVHDEMRRLIMLHTARAEVALLETHVDNAVNFIEILENDVSFNEAVELYREALEVRNSVGDVVHSIALDRVSDDYLPRLGARSEDSDTTGDRRLEEEPESVT